MPDDDLLTGLVEETPAPRQRRRTQAPGLDPQFQTQVDEIIGSLKSRGLSARVAQGYRSPQQQEDYYAQGRTKPGPIVTYARAGTGKHPRGLAADIDLIDNTGKPLSGNDPSWRALGEEAQRRGLGWGGNWKKLRDLRHVESRRSDQAQVVTAPKPQKDDLETGIVGDDDLLSGVVKEPIDSALTSTVQNLQQKSAEAKRRQAMQAKVEQARIGVQASVNMGRKAPQPMGVGELRRIEAEDARRAAMSMGDFRKSEGILANVQRDVATQQTPDERAAQRAPNARMFDVARTGEEEVLRRTQEGEAAAEKARQDEAWHKAHKEQIDNNVNTYRKAIRVAGSGPTAGGANKWLAEMGAKGGAGLAEFVGGLPGSKGGDDLLRIHAEAMARAAAEEGADRSAISKFTQDIAGGFIGTAPELAAMSLGVPPVVAFGVGGGVRARSRGESVPGGVIHGTATGGAFELAKGGEGIRDALKHAGAVGAGTTAVELAAGRPLREAAATGATNALIAGVPGVVKGARRAGQIEPASVVADEAVRTGGAPTRESDTDLAVRDGAANVSPDVPVRGLPAEGAVPAAVEQAERRQVRREFDKIKESAGKPAEIPVTPAPTPPEAAQPAQAKTTAPALKNDTITQQGSAELKRRDLELLGNVSESPAFREQGLSGLDAKTRSEVMDIVLRQAHDPQVRDVIVQSVPVNMVNDLLRAKSPSQILLHDPAVLPDPSTVALHDSIPVPMDIATSLVRRLGNLQRVGSTDLSGMATTEKPLVSSDLPGGAQDRVSANIASSRSGSVRHEETIPPNATTATTAPSLERGVAEPAKPVEQGVAAPKPTEPVREEVIQQPSKPAEKGEPQNVEKAVAPAPDVKIQPSLSTGEAGAAPNKPNTPAEPSVELARARKEAFEANRSSFDLPLIKAEKANLKLKVDVTYESESGRSVTKKVTVEKFQKELERKQSVLNKLLDCVHA